MSEESNRQLDAWLAGNPFHNKIDDECCPDFSCCNKQMKTPLPARKRFYQAVKAGDDRVKYEMLGMFLGQAAETMGKKVYVAGLEVSEEQ